MYAKLFWGVLFVTLLSTAVQSRRVNVRPAGPEDDSVPQSDGEQQFKPVLIARRPLQQRVPSAEVESERQSVVVVRQSPRLLQQRPREEEREDDEEPQQPPPQQVLIRQPSPKSVQQLRAQPPAQQLLQQRSKEPQPQEQQKEPTAQTIRNFNKLNDDGSFTFGYEADDGSFKEETRGTDCVVRGKYGYVDPDGNKREFSYVQGNPCDPNAVSAEDDDEQQQPGGGKPDEEENVPANVPRPKPKKNNNRPTTTLFQQTFGDFEQPRPQPQQSAGPRQPGRQETVRRPQPQIISPQLPQQQQFVDLPSSTAAAPSSTQLPFRPSAGSADNLESAIRNLPAPSGKPQPVPAGPNSPLYTTELVFDPSTGQYNTVIYQQVPKQPVGININQRLPLAPARQPQPQFQPHSPPQFQSQPPPQFQPQSQFRPSVGAQPFQRPVEFDFQRPAPSSAVQQQQLVQQQQALMFQQSQNLFRQQQKQQQQVPFQPQSTQFFPPPPPQQSQRFAGEPSQFAPLPKQQRFEPQPEAHQQQFVLVQPGRTPGQQSLAVGQIDAFLRGHNVQF